MGDLEWKRGVDQKLKELFQRVKPSRRAKGGGGGGSSSRWIEALSYDALPDVSGPESIPGEIGYTKMAKITAGEQEGQIYKIRNGIWECVGERYEANSKAALPNGPYIQRGAVGIVVAGDDEGMYCIRDYDGSGWVAINVLE